MRISEWNMDIALKVREEEGMEKGARRAQLEIAKRMKVKGESVEEIEKMTGLTVDDVLRL